LTRHLFWQFEIDSIMRLRFRQSLRDGFGRGRFATDRGSFLLRVLAAPSEFEELEVFDFDSKRNLTMQSSQQSGPAFVFGRFTFARAKVVVAWLGAFVLLGAAAMAQTAEWDVIRTIRRGSLRCGIWGFPM
jgi:hypothetical protein